MFYMKQQNIFKRVCLFVCLFNLNMWSQNAKKFYKD